MIKTKKQQPALPIELDQMLDVAFHYAALAKEYETRSDEHRKQVQNWLENTDEMEVTQGEGIKHRYGSVIYQQRSNYRIDTDEIIAMFNRGEIAIETLVNLAFPEGRIARVEPLKVALGERFDTMTQLSTTEFITLRPNANFKQKALELLALPEDYVRAEFVIEDSSPDQAPAEIPLEIKAKSLDEIFA